MFDSLKIYELTSNVADRFNGLFNFNVDSQMVQHKMVDMGRILSRVISMEFTLRLEEYGFNRNLINNSLRTLEDKVEQLMTTFKNQDTADVVDDYEENSAWVRFVAPELQYD
jgi:hypothetical protein